MGARQGINMVRQISIYFNTYRHPRFKYKHTYLSHWRVLEKGRIRRITARLLTAFILCLKDVRSDRQLKDLLELGVIGILYGLRYPHKLGPDEDLFQVPIRKQPFLKICFCVTFFSLVKIEITIQVSGREEVLSFLLFYK